MWLFSITPRTTTSVFTFTGSKVLQGGKGAKQGATKGGDRGDWSDVRPRKRKAHEQVVGQWDRLRDDQRHRGTRDRRQGRSRVRNRFEYTDWYGSDEGSDYDNQEFSNNGTVTIDYVRPQKTKFRDSLRYEDNHVLERRRSHSSKREKEALELTDTGHVQQSYQRQRKTLPHQEPTHSKKVNQDVVSFYFTNIPHDISYVALRQGFEVCGIMEDVYLARKRNVNGGAFGFVRYGKVKDVDKLLKALNNVWFGDWKVVAKVASFGRNGNHKGGGRGRREGEKGREGDKKLEGEKREDGSGKVVEGVKRDGDGRKGT